MRRHLGGKVGHLAGQHRQRCLVPFGQFLDALGQRLADAIHFAVDVGVNGGEPFVLDDQRLDVGLAELGVLGVGKRVY